MSRTRRSRTYRYPFYAVGTSDRQSPFHKDEKRHMVRSAKAKAKAAVRRGDEPEAEKHNHRAYLW